MSLEWGNVPSWVGSVLTSVSVGLGAITYARSTGDRRRALDDAERAQAARVSLWWENPRKANVRNSNDVAVTVQVFVPDRDGGSEPLGLGPGETRVVQLPAGLAGEPVALAVVDSFGRRWVRRPGGELERVTSESSAPRSTSGPERIRWESR
jgi:hypothetical protein